MSLASTLLNWGIDAIQALGLRIPPLDPDGLIAAARRKANLQNLGATFPWEALRLAAHAIEANKDLHLIARVALRMSLINALVLRLRLEEARQRDPQLERRSIRPSLIVCGLPRSGTTFLHRLLANLDDARPLLLWELLEPIPGRGPDQRRAKAERDLARLRRWIPASMDAQHLVRPELPDECMYLMRAALAGPTFYTGPQGGRYLELSSERDMLPVYRDWRALLSLLDVPGKRLVLKDPHHSANLPELFTVLPDALVVRTHRNPVEVVPSYHQLVASWLAIICRRFDLPRMVEHTTRLLEDMATRMVAADDDPRLPHDRVIDVDYRALVQNPLAAVRGICRHFDIPWKDEYPERLEQFINRNRQRAYGENTYSCEEYGQTKEYIADRFRLYIERYRIT
jgi:hypothetical protein